MVGAFAPDKRVLAWELYNEPGRRGEQSRPLVEAAFPWAREAKPSQPRHHRRIYGQAEMQKPHHGTVGRRLLPQLRHRCRREGRSWRICHDYGRPVLCTEWMARGAGSRFETHLPFFKENKIACWNWGLVAGRTQTYFPWGSPKGAPEPKLWHHDILRADGTPFKAREVEFIKVTTGKLPASALPQRRIAGADGGERLPCRGATPWRSPADDWFKPDFNDADWKQGAAPFGREEPPIARKPNTPWTSADLWLRREFEMPRGPVHRPGPAAAPRRGHRGLHQRRAGRESRRLQRGLRVVRHFAGSAGCAQARQERHGRPLPSDRRAGSISTWASKPSSSRDALNPNEEYTHGNEPIEIYGRVIFRCLAGNGTPLAESTRAAGSRQRRITYRVNKPGPGADEMRGYYADLSTNTLYLSQLNNGWRPLATVGAAVKEASTNANGSRVLQAESFKHYVESFNQKDRETVVNHIPNAAAWNWIARTCRFSSAPTRISRRSTTSAGGPTASISSRRPMGSS